MDDSGFPKPVDDIVTTLADIYRHQGQAALAELLECCNAQIAQTEYDNWNGGTYTYELRLEVPVPIFADIESDLEKVEKGMSEKVGAICRNQGNHHLSGVTISPLSSKAISIRTKVADSQVRHIWTDGLFRLFLSHVSAHKVAVGKLKSELMLRGISGFVAHEDIAPSREWQDEIELALRSMNSLAALLTPDFHPSKWTDQEIGFALGKGVVVIPVRYGADPYGFIGKVQGFAGSLDNPSAVAATMADTLLSNSLTRREMRSAIASAFASATSKQQATILAQLITSVRDFTEREKSQIQTACQKSFYVNYADVVNPVYESLGISLASVEATEDEIPF